MIGLFINTIPVRIPCENQMKFIEIMQRVQQEAVQSQPHHVYPLASIQAQSGLKQNLLDHILVFENYPIAERVKGEKLETFAVETFEQTNYDFNLVIVMGEQLDLEFKFNRNVYEKVTVEKIVKHFKIVLRQILHDNRLKIKDITLLSEEEKKQILFEFNETKGENPEDQTIHELFVRQVEKTPHQIALAHTRERNHNRSHMSHMSHMSYLSYSELNEKSHRLAHLLIEKGVKTETIVAIMVERSLEMIIGILAILKSGGVYMPIDPDNPQERIDYMLKDSNAKILVNEEFLNPSALRNSPLERGASSLHLKSAGGGGVCLNPQRAVSTFNLSYIIYTSGTTGTPRGVMVTHGNVVRLVKEPNYIRLAQGERLLMTGTIAFDITTFEIWGPLLNGMSLYIAVSRYNHGSSKIENFNLDKPGIYLAPYTPTIRSNGQRGYLRYFQALNISWWAGTW
jgi:non-ribosomal peptide synthetase component F